MVKGKRWLLLTRWVNLTASQRQELNALFALNRRLLKACLLKESLDRLWDYRSEAALLRRGRGYQNLRYLLFNAQRMAASRTEFVTLRKAA